jgi:hypothetical protein
MDQDPIHPDLQIKTNEPLDLLLLRGRFNKTECKKRPNFNSINFNCFGGFHALSDPLVVQAVDLMREQELCVCGSCGALWKYAI